MRVIGTDASIEKTVTCKNCASIIAYLPVDCKDTWMQDAKGASYRLVYLDCPVCRVRVISRKVRTRNA